jgi:type IV secretory pathway VirD2 relaxase
MQVRQALEIRMTHTSRERPEGPEVRLPGRLKTDIAVRTGMLRRLAASRTFAWGDRKGALRAARGRSGRPFRLDVRQRVVVKALVSRHAGRGTARAEALLRHVQYLSRYGAGADGVRPVFFDARSDRVEAEMRAAAWAAHRHHFRLIVSPEHGDRIADLRDYVRTVMRHVCADLGEPGLPWMAVCHFDTDQPHAHVLLPGRRGDGRDLVIPRAYVSYGIRARAQEVAQERLGDLTRGEAERRVWRETRADRFTAFDRRLLAAADASGQVADGVGGGDAWTALTRGRLRHLERLGLATRSGDRFRLADDLETRLKRLQASGDVIRTLNQRRLASGRHIRQLRSERASGVVVRSGSHDELGAQPFAILGLEGGGEGYVRLAFGAVPPRPGATVTLDVDARGIGRASPARGRMLER